jgi:AcrR family transcriptional regulator
MGGDRRERILVATPRSLLDRHADGREITIGHVAAAARVGRATVYRYLPNKAALLQAATSTNGAHPVPLEPRARIIDAALDLLAGRGPHATTLSEIASRAGLSLSGLHRHSKTKDELIAAVAQYVPILPTLMAELLPATADEADLEEQLTHIAEVVLEVFKRRRGLMRFAIFEAAIYPDVARLGATHTMGRFLPALAELF